MLHPFLRHVQSTALFTASDRLLLACSGGLDSTVLAYLLREGGFDLAIAHVNFQLRGEESEADEAFVREVAQLLNVEYFVTRFATAKEATERGESIQMAARRLRYDWLETVREQAGFDYIVTAHHNDDRIETFLLHFLRGTGLRGLSSIPATEGVLRRPLLFTDREALAAYAEEEAIPYREDSSNATDDYDRNYLRHHVLPHLRSLEPGLTKRTARNFANLREERAILKQQIATQQAEYCRWVGAELHIDRRFLRATPGGRTYLHYWLADSGLTPDQLQQALVARPGTLLEAPERTLLVQEDTLILRPREDRTDRPVEIPAPGTYDLPDGGTLELATYSGEPDFRDPHQAFLPADRLEWPLQLRHWRDGDRFQPFGMGGRSKKLQNFFTDEKLNRFERSAIWLLCDARDHIVWVVGQRTDERFRLRGTEKALLRCRYRPPGSEK